MPITTPKPFEPGPAEPRLASGEVHLWRARLSAAPAGIGDALSPDERNRAGRFHFDRDRDRFIAGRGLLRSILGRYLDIEPRDLIFGVGPHGKPELEGVCSSLRFNVSHSDDVMLVAVTHARAIGVDVEFRKENIPFEMLAEHYFEPEDAWSVRTLPAADKAWRFYDIWTSTEARLKASGLGLSQGTKVIEPDRWSLRMLSPARVTPPRWPSKAGISTGVLVMAELTSALPEYEIVIEPSRGWFNLRWRELWDYRDLLLLLIQRDFISRYKQTILGPVWFILQPVFTMAIFVVMFGRVAGLPTDGIPRPLFYLCGLLGWQYFQQNITTGGATFVNNAQLFGKVWFPRLIVPLATVLSNLVSLALQLIPFFLYLLYYRFVVHDMGTVTFSWLVLLAPLPLLQTILLSVGVSLWMAASTAKYRDLVHLNQYLVQLWMFATPIVFPLSLVKAKWPWLVWLNPMSVPTEAFRMCLLGRGVVTPFDAVVSGCFTLAILVSGLMLFQRVERTVVDSV